MESLGYAVLTDLPEHLISHLYPGKMSSGSVQINTGIEAIAWASYSDRLFTKFNDRLVAIAEVTKVHEHVCGDRYLACLWQSSLVQGLCWEFFRNGELPPGDILYRRWPTWSWTSHNAKIFYQIDDELFLADPDFELNSVI